MKKIDVHIHTSMWEKAHIQPGIILASPEEIQESYRELDVEKGFLMPLISPEYRFCVQTNEEVEYLANKYPDTFYWFCNVDPRMGFNRADCDLSEMLMHYKNRGAIGVGEVTASLSVDDPLVENLFYHCAECDLPVVVNGFLQVIYVVINGLVHCFISNYRFKASTVFAFRSSVAALRSSAA